MVFHQYLFRSARTGATTRGHPELFLDCVQRVGAMGGGFANLAVGDAVADTDVHSYMRIQMRMIVNTVK
jgi:hypothetical protein